MQEVFSITYKDIGTVRQRIADLIDHGYTIEGISHSSCVVGATVYFSAIVTAHKEEEPKKMYKRTTVWVVLLTALLWFSAGLAIGTSI